MLARGYYHKIFLLIHDGFYCAHTGAGVHNFRVIKLLRNLFPFSDIEICPIYTSKLNNDYQPHWHSKVLDIINKDNLRFYPIDNNSNGMNRYGGLTEWCIESQSAAHHILDYVKNDKNILCISIDTPFIQTIPVLANANNVHHLHIPKSSGIIHSPENQSRILLERKIYNHIPDNTRIGEIGRYMKKHLITDYGLDKDKIVPAHNGCIVEDYSSLEKSLTKYLEKKWHLDTDDRKVICAYGRSIKYKGFHTLVNAMSALPNNYYRLLLNANTDSIESEKYKASLVELAKRKNVSLEIHTEFDPYFPKFIRRHNKTIAIVVPSLNEPFGLIPSETFFDPKAKAIIICSNAGGLPYQVSNRITGLIFERSSSESLMSTLVNVCSMSLNDRNRMLTSAHNFALKNFDLENNLLRCFDKFLQSINS